jgi:hypothetical protein
VGRELLLHPRGFPRPETASHPAGVGESVTVPRGNRQGGQLSGMADHREVPHLVDDHLLPVGSPAGVVGGVGALGDDALQPHLLHRLVEGLPFRLHRLDVPHSSPLRGEQPEQLAAAGERQAAQVVSLGGEEVERPVGGGGSAGQRTAPLCALLQQGERGTSLAVLHHHLSIEDEVVGGKRPQRRHHLGELLGGVASTAVPEPDLLAAPLREDAVAVVLQLEPPPAAGEGPRSTAGELEIHVCQPDLPLGCPGLLDRTSEGRGRDRPVARRASAGGHAVGGISTLSWRLVRSARGPSPSAW